MQNNFPRIYSLSTIGIKQHFNADYLFHPNRTDFSGESGSGKSMIADMIQLVLVGSSLFQSSTEANKDRDVKGMLQSSGSKASARGYILLNVEVQPKKYYGIGAYIESTSNVAEMFIIQNGYSWDELTPLTSPIFAKHLIKEEKVDTLKNICENTEFVRIKNFKRKHYHQILYQNNIISLDLTKEDTLKTYASILRSFSRGKGFKTSSENLKKFLFGDEDQNAIMERYKEDVNNINNDFHEHNRYKQEIEQIDKKQNILNTLVEKSKKYKSLYTEYLVKKHNYWNTLKSNTLSELVDLNARIVGLRTDSLYIDKQLLINKLNELKELIGLESKLSDINSDDLSNSNIESAFMNSKQALLSIKKVDEWLAFNDSDIEKVKNWYYKETAELEEKRKLEAFINYLTIHKINEEFESSGWLNDYENEEVRYVDKISRLELEIKNLEAMSQFADVDNEESLSRWAMHNLPFPISHLIESVLIYFQKYGRNKPLDNSGNRYIGIPEKLFKNLDSRIKDNSVDGFWMSLDGVYEYIDYVPNPILNVENCDDILKSLAIIKDQAKTKLKELIKEKREAEHLKRKLYEYGNIAEQITLFKRKDSLLNFDLYDGLGDISNSQFDSYIEQYLDKETIIAMHNRNQDSYHEFLSRKTVFEKGERRKETLKKKYFKNALYNTDLIENSLANIHNEIREIDLELSDFNERLFCCQYDVDSEESQDFLILKLNNKALLQKLEFEKEQKESSVKLSNSALEETFRLNEEILAGKIIFDNNSIEINNPDEGGETSRKTIAERSLSDYLVFLKITADQYQLEENITIGQLANALLPTIFPSTKVDESSISNDIVVRLNKLTHDIQEIGSRKVDILGSIFNEVYRTYSQYLSKITEIDNFLKKRNNAITGGNKASLTAKKSILYPDSWLNNFRKQLNNQMNNAGLFSGLYEEIDINEMMIKAFRKLGGSVKVEPSDLMDPKSYFDLEFELRLDNNEVNSGSNGQTYAANALLCLARLSLIESKEEGIRIMPIDEAEGLGSNYDMLHELAKKEKYQIVTMAIETAGELTDDGQYVYIMNENNLADPENYVPPLGIFANEIVKDIDGYINSLFTENE
ncbi:hypothetical protein [uncultured Sphingobacterium sp.]|uniref:hypothetical protein n=1 Tax=uncultured Sphingobacterium sp. TaxID=182688 RepID=UPI0025D299FB|nr:hypothetical protein [uncultured Sphingobacterium sp.]